MASFELPVSKNIWDFDPTSISGCTLWLDGADANTVFSNTAGTTPATNGGNVSRWNDKSGLNLKAILNNNTSSYNTIYGTTPPTRDNNFINFGIGTITATATSSSTNRVTVTSSFTISAGQHVSVLFAIGGLGNSSPYYVFNPTGTPTTSFQLVTNPLSTSPIVLTDSSSQNIMVLLSSASLILPYGSLSVNGTGTTFTVQSATPQNAMSISNGQTVNFTTVGTIGGINTSTTYFVVNVDSNSPTQTFSVSLSLGGTAVSLTTGTGASANIGRGSFLNSQQDCTMFVVSRSLYNFAGVNSGVFSYGQYIPYASRGIIMLGQSGSQISNATLPIDTTSTAGISNSLNLVSGTFNNSIQSGWLNGSPFNNINLFDLQINGGNWQTGTVVASVGAFLPAYPMYGYIAEVLYYNAALSNTDRQTIEGYLAWKWGIQSSLPTIHPYFNQIRPFSRNFVPTDIDGCQFWIDPADRTTVTLNGTSNVTQILDKSGQGNTVANASSTLTYATTMNGLPTIVGPSGTANNTITTTNTSIARDTVNHSEFYVYRYSSTPSSSSQTISPQRVLFASNGQFLGMSLASTSTGGASITLVASSTTSPSTITLSTPANTNNLVVNQPVQFTSTFGGITSGVTYFIFSKTSNAITISTTSFGVQYTGVTTSATGGSGSATVFSPYFEENNNIVGGGPVVSSFPTVMQNVSSYDIALLGNTYVVGLVRQNGVYTLTVNGAVVATGSSPNSNLSPIFYQIFVGNQGANIGDVIIYNAALNVTERQQVEGYLLWKWGLRGGNTTTNMVIPTTHPFYKFPPPSSTPFQPEVQFYRKQFDPSDLSPVIWIDPKDNTTITKDATTSRVTSITNKGSYSGTLTNPTAGTGTGISGPLVTTATTGSGFRQQFLDFSNGGNYQVTNVTVGASPFTQLTLTVSPPHNGAIPVGAFVNFTLSSGSGSYPGGASSILDIGPFQILTATVSGGTTLTITTLSNHAIGNSQSVFLTINTGTFLGGGDASALTGAYTTASSGNTGTTIIIPITTSTNGLMAITDGHVRNNLGTTGPYITQAGTTGSTVILTSYSPRASAGSLSPIGRIEYGQVAFTSAVLTTTTSLTLRTPIDHGLSSGNVVGICFNNTGTLPFQIQNGVVPTTGTTLNGASLQFTSATVSGGTTLTITVTTNPFFINSATPNYVGLSPIRLTLLTGTTFTGGTSATGISASSLVTQTGSNATTIVLTIASSPNGALTFAGLPGILVSDTSTGSNSFNFNGTQTLSAGTTGNTIVVPVPSFAQAITGRLVTQGGLFQSWNAFFPNACLLFPLNGYAIEATSMGSALTTNAATIVWVSCLTNNYYRNSQGGSNSQCPVIATSVSLNGSGGGDTTSGGRDYKIQAFSGAGNAPRIGIIHNNGGSSFFFFVFTDSVSPFRVNSAVVNVTANTIGDVGPNLTGAATYGMRYDNLLRNGTYSVLNSGRRTTTLTPSHLRIGGNTNATTNYTTHPMTGQWYEGGVGDILIFNSILTLEQRQLVEGYLAQKYACQTYLGLTSVSLNTTASYNITSGSVSGSAPFTITLGGTFTTAFSGNSQITITGATPSGLNNTWTLTTSSTTQVQFISDISYTWSSGGSIAGVTTSGANFIHPYRLNPTSISASVDLTQRYAQGLATWFDAANSSTIGFASGNIVNSWTSSGGNLGMVLTNNVSSSNWSNPTYTTDSSSRPYVRFLRLQYACTTVSVDASNGILITSPNIVPAADQGIVFNGTIAPLGSFASYYIKSVTPVSGNNYTITVSTSVGGATSTVTENANLVISPTINRQSTLKSSVTTFTMAQHFTTQSSNNEYTNILVFSRDGTGGQFLINYATNGNTRFTIEESTRRCDYNLNGSAVTTQPITYSSTTLLTNIPYILINYRRGLSSFTRLIGNNTIVNTTVNNSSNLAFNTVIASLRMGSYDQPDSNHGNAFSGGIYEHMLFKYALTDQQIFQIEGYLAWKWGLQASLPTTHQYYKIRP
jgi:hypothetical protein